MQRVSAGHRLRLWLNGVPLRHGANADVSYDTMGTLQLRHGILPALNALEREAFRSATDGTAGLIKRFEATSLKRGTNYLMVAVVEGKKSEAAWVRHVEPAVWYRG